MRQRGAIKDSLWNMIRHCWAQTASERPNASLVAETLRSIVEESFQPLQTIASSSKTALSSLQPGRGLCAIAEYDYEVCLNLS